MIRMEDVIIIGAGPTGIYAAFQAGLRQLKARVFDASPSPGGQLTSFYPEKPIYDIPGVPSVKAGDFVQALMNQYAPFAKSIPMHLSTSIQSIKQGQDHYEVITDNGDSYQSKFLILATGSGRLIPRVLEVEHLAVRHRVHYTIHDIASFKDKDVAVLGGGDSALDWANVLLGVAKSVTLVHRRKVFRAMEHSLESFQKQGHLHAGFEVKAVTEKDQKIKLQLIDTINLETRKIDVDDVIVCYGFLTTRGVYEAWGLHTEQHEISVSSSLETNLHNVFAVGNVTHFEGKSHTIAAGFGEVMEVIETIQHRLFPEKKILYSSFLKKP
jgi:ferredoxin/flavodoxin---NADP+ reductase